tara:strand:+ start:3611 stop:4621 length:1011 start_codon:yes stop_codon:yes gene_type:complete
MKFKVKNKSNMDFTQFKPLLKSFMSYASKEMGFQKPPSLFFVSDERNASLPLGKTAHYDPASMEVVIYTDMRHPKDILRSLSHELVHHKQNCDGQFNNLAPTTDGYAQNDKHLRSMEKEAYLLGNMCLRDWEDTHKKQLQESSYYSRGDNKMNTKDWSRMELNTLLMEQWGYKKPINEGIEHLCAMKVTEKATGRVGHPINHTLLEDGTVTHYDVEFDDMIVEGMPAETLDAVVTKEHMHSAKRDDDKKSSKPRKPYMEEEEELDEAHCGKRDEDELDEEKMPMKTDTEDADEDGDKTDKVPAFLDKGETKKKKVTEAQIRSAIREALKQHLSKRK